MTREELEKKVFELEQENKALIAHINNRARKDRLPPNANERWPFISYEWDCETSLSYLIRAICFPKSKNLTTRRYGSRGKEGALRKTEQIITLAEMSDEQHKGYIEAATEILDILKRHRDVYFNQK